MPLTSAIASYDPGWLNRYDEEATRIRPIFGQRLLEYHHVGSTAVPGLSAKPEIDILAIVDDQMDCEDWTKGLSVLGYVRGRDLSFGHLFYRRNVGRVRTHKIHVCINGHDQIRAMLAFRDMLRSDSDLRERYQELKLRLERENTSGIGEYLDGKKPFIDAVLASLDATYNDAAT